MWWLIFLLKQMEMMTLVEEWKTCIYNGVTYDGYEVSNLGHVRSLNYNGTKSKVQELKYGKNNGYLYVVLRKNGKQKRCLVHRLVAYAFIPNDDETKTDVNHIDHNRHNNHVSNLQWCTHQYNIEYSHAKRVLCIETGVIYDSVRQAEREIGLAESGISACCNGKQQTCGGYRWEYVD